MRVYQIGTGNKEIPFDYVVSFDPAISVTGVALLDRKRGRLATRKIETELNPSTLSVPELCRACEKVTQMYLELIARNCDDLSRTVVTFEHHVLQGNFSPGLSALLSVFQSRLKDMNLAAVYATPPNASAFFLKKRKSTKTEHVTFAKELFGVKRRISHHEADALVSMALVLYDKIGSYFKTDYRKPDYEVINVL